MVALPVDEETKGVGTHQVSRRKLRRHLHRLVTGAISGAINDHELEALPRDMAGSAAKRAVGQIMKSTVITGIVREEDSEAQDGSIEAVHETLQFPPD